MVQLCYDILRQLPPFKEVWRKSERFRFTRFKRNNSEHEPN